MPQAAPAFGLRGPPRPDFNGLWFCFDTVGDMDALLSALEVGWAKRCAASAINYGAGRRRGRGRRSKWISMDVRLYFVGVPPRNEPFGSSLPRDRLSDSRRVREPADHARGRRHGDGGSKQEPDLEIDRVSVTEHEHRMV